MNDSSLEKPLISIIIVQYNNGWMTRRAIDSFRRHYRGDHEIILVDNATTDAASRELLRSSESFKVLSSQENLGFSVANNRGAAAAQGDVLLLLNNDTITKMDFVSPILDQFRSRQDIGIIGPRLNNEDGSLQLSCGRLPSLRQEAIDKILYRYVDARRPWARRYVERKYHAPQFVEWVTGAALFVRKDLFSRLNGLDEEIFMFFEDKDLCARALGQGAKILYFPEVTVTHVRGATSAAQHSDIIRSIYQRGQMHYYLKHRNLLERIALRLYHREFFKGS